MDTQTGLSVWQTTLHRKYNYIILIAKTAWRKWTPQTLIIIKQMYI